MTSDEAEQITAHLQRIETMVRETNTVTPARMAMPAKEEKMARKSGDCRLG